MTALLIATVRVDDPETYAKYTARTPEILARHGGRFIVRGGPVTVLEGEPFNERLVVVEFPSREAMQAMYDSPDYQQAMVFRHASSQARFLMVDTVPEGEAAPDARVERSG